MSDKAIDLGLTFDNSYFDKLDGFYVVCSGAKAPNPDLIKLNETLAENIGLTNTDTESLAQIFSGSEVSLGSSPLAQVYAGHQFGGFSPQLGDGRALLLGEVLDKNGLRVDIQLKGSGRTPFSRGGDGKAVLGAVLREYILSEAMYALNIPTTRALAVVITGEPIYRTQYLPGAVLTRVASSHLRVGTFQYFASRGEQDKVKQLADYAIARHYSELQQSKLVYLDFLCAVRDKQAELVAKWLLVGFIHGVMNTDNMAISGETIDYGPCAFMDNYGADIVFSLIDSDGRYSYNNQPVMAQWNLARLAETLLPLIHEDQDEAIELATTAVTEFWDIFQHHWATGMRAKLGLSSEEEGDFVLGEQLLESMSGEEVDFTHLFRQLADDLANGTDESQRLFNHADKFLLWRESWIARLARDTLSMSDRISMMNSANPIYIPRNYQVERAIEAAEQRGDYQPFEQLIVVLASPYTLQTGAQEYAEPAPLEFGPYTTFCGT
ncbi:YdiU family protein [Shewanella sp. D64]|uniref:protein adenylyltransferase SelO n=1 Tax=unclassified Shewanella TaxID=196818 RepID=UPI0022BA24AB|nr:MULTISPECIES: YdiU family protein [unclassified Shewanella]MEC4727507.1 YdiU family protein [Shewanella sp. D64]MEC4738084.1 YdiU family protein [Shewanella sp. E94]WBJ96401.1 YdiU family protein [Shewanella sp. MTB7]